MSNQPLLPLLKINERPIPTIGYIGEMPEIVALPTGYNQAISELEHWEFDEEALAKAIFEYECEQFSYGIIKWEKMQSKIVWIKKAKAILANLPSILVKKSDTTVMS